MDDPARGEALRGQGVAMLKEKYASTNNYQKANEKINQKDSNVTRRRVGNEVSNCHYVIEAQCVITRVRGTTFKYFSTRRPQEN